jgi:hypothetical protein
MHPYLIRLGVHPEAQVFFQPFYTVDRKGDLVFNYGDSIEHYGIAFHKIPVSENLFLAGSRNFHTVSHVIICTSAMDAMAYLSLNLPYFRDIRNLLFLATGTKPGTDQAHWINKNLAGKSFTCIFGNDLLGRVAEVKLAAGIRKMPAAVTVQAETVIVNFRMKDHVFTVDGFSLNALEKKAGYRFNIPVDKPKSFDSWIEHLQHHTFNY